ncbi:MAG: FKBP-type peptidyl-prolyl cis-trans isomerase [Nevskiales bacterium]|nr:FKBP-type peptidyl-prolyl cis-trans isomerase [Nevskiales bacterium]
MNIACRFFALLLLAGVAAACTKPSELRSDTEKFSYAMGVDMGNRLKPVKDELDMDALVLGLQDALAGQTPRLSKEESATVITSISDKLREKMAQEREAKARAAQEAGAKFLAENAKRQGVKTTASGLQYEMLVEGSGFMPKPDDEVTVHYKGAFLNGEEFDSSYARGEAVTFPLNNVIPGWVEGLQLMKTGGKAKLYIPSSLAYGESGAGSKIGPNETLIFEIELLKIDKAAAALNKRKQATKK